MAAEANVIYEAERCSGTFKITYDNKECNRCPRKSEADKHFAEAPRKASGLHLLSDYPHFRVAQHIPAHHTTT